jgi:hypothetical protein
MKMVMVNDPISTERKFPTEIVLVANLTVKTLKFSFKTVSVAGIDH